MQWRIQDIRGACQPQMAGWDGGGAFVITYYSSKFSCKLLENKENWAKGEGVHSQFYRKDLPLQCIRKP